MKIILLTIVLFVFQVFAVDWAVIVAGSSTWSNYRHQADACHARKLIKENGIPDDHIITLVFDDIANNPQNPFPGKIFNKPDKTGAGVDVYAGCIVAGDYTGTDVNVDNFMALLVGDSTKVPAGKKVLQSTANDNVFINFVDHGGTGVIAFPDRLMTNTELVNTLKNMNNRNMYSKLVFYLEACESGSMFEGLLEPSMNIYVTTASGPAQSSWGTYCPPNDYIDGKPMATCLGDLYEVSWMENTEDAGDLETLAEQYKIVQQEVTMSKVMQYGDLAYTELPVGDFVGGASARLGVKKDRQDDVPSCSSTVDSHNIPLHLAYYKYLRTDQKDFAARQIAAQYLQYEISRRSYADQLFMNLARAFAGTEQLAEDLFNAPAQTPVICGQCCSIVNNAFKEFCGAYDDYSIQYSRVVYNMCAFNQTDKVVGLLLGLCLQ